MSGAKKDIDPVAAVTGWTLNERGKRAGSELTLDLKTASGRAARLVAGAITRETWKLTLVPAGIEPPRPTPMVLPIAIEPVRLVAKPGKSVLVISGPELTLEIRLDPFSFRFLDQGGRAVLADNPSDVDGLGRPAVPPLGFLTGPGGVLGVVAAFHLGPEERLYGLGEKFTRLDKAGQRIVSWTVDALGSTSERSHKNVPFLWSSRGFGIFLRLGRPDLLGPGRDVASILDVRSGGPGPRPLRPPRPAPREDHLSLHFSHRPSAGPSRHGHSACGCPPAELTGTRPRSRPSSRASNGTGFPRMSSTSIPGGCAGGTIATSRGIATPSPIQKDSSAASTGLDSSSAFGSILTFRSKARFSKMEKPKAISSASPTARSTVIDYGLSLAPRPDGRVRVAGPKETWNAPVAIIDLTHPEARAWFKDLHRPLFRMGIDVFKTDFGEDIPKDARFHDGRTGRELHNLYPLLYNEAVFEVTAEEKGRGLVWSRSGTAGSQRFPVGWSGDPASDWDSLAATVRGGLSAGMSGLSLWSHDIGGYRGTPDPELYVRWAQFGLFSSHSRMHGDSPREPWLFGEEALAIVRKFARLRYRLFPYILSAALESRDTGMPVIRALPLVFPDDPNAALWDREYMFGPSFLVAPVIHRMTDLARTGGRGGGPPAFPVYLPAGDWIDYWTGRTNSGPGVVAAPAPLRIMPLFVRAGAIVPMIKSAARIPEGLFDPLEVEIYPSASSVCTLLEEGGQTVFRLDRIKQGFSFAWSGPLARTLVVRMGRGWELGGAFRMKGGKGAMPALRFERRGERSVTVRGSGAARGKIRLVVRPAGPGLTSS